MLDITKLRELCEKVTPGPWKVVKSDLGDEDICCVPTEIVGADGFPVISYEGGLAPDCPWKRSTIEANAEFIAKVRTAFPELLNEIERIKEELEQYKEALRLACKEIVELQTGFCKDGEEIDLMNICLTKAKGGS